MENIEVLNEANEHVFEANWAKRQTTDNLTNIKVVLAPETVTTPIQNISIVNVLTLSKRSFVSVFLIRCTVYKYAAEMGKKVVSLDCKIQGQLDSTEPKQTKGVECVTFCKLAWKELDCAAKQVAQTSYLSPSFVAHLSKCYPRRRFDLRFNIYNLFFFFGQVLGLIRKRTVVECAAPPPPKKLTYRIFSTCCRDKCPLPDLFRSHRAESEVRSKIPWSETMCYCHWFADADCFWRLAVWLFWPGREDGKAAFFFCLVCDHFASIEENVFFVTVMDWLQCSRSARTLALKVFVVIMIGTDFD